MRKKLAEKWVEMFRVQGGPWPEDDHWPEEWLAVEREMEKSDDVANCGGGGYESEKSEGGNAGTPYVFIDNSGFLLSGGDGKAFPAIRIFSAQEIAELKAVWARAESYFPRLRAILENKEIEWLEEHIAGAEADIEKGSKVTPEQLAEARKEIAAAAARDTKLQDTLLSKGWILSKDAQGNPAITRLPGYEEAAKNMQQQLAEAVANFRSKNPNGDATQDPEVKSVMDVFTG
jgi:hypothetical protein